MLNSLHLEQNGIPVYLQLREQILGLIGAGRLKPGDQLPTMREVAVALMINLNTVQHAYRELEQQGVLVTQRGRGTFVSPQPNTSSDNKASRLRDFALQTIGAAKSHGFSPQEVANTIRDLAED